MYNWGLEILILFFGFLNIYISGSTRSGAIVFYCQRMVTELKALEKDHETLKQKLDASKARFVRFMFYALFD